MISSRSLGKDPSSREKHFLWKYHTFAVITCTGACIVAERFWQELQFSIVGLIFETKTGYTTRDGREAPTPAGFVVMLHHLQVRYIWWITPDSEPKVHFVAVSFPKRFDAGFNLSSFC